VESLLDVDDGSREEGEDTTPDAIDLDEVTDVEVGEVVRVLGESTAEGDTGTQGGDGETDGDSDEQLDAERDELTPWVSASNDGGSVANTVLLQES